MMHEKELQDLLYSTGVFHTRKGYRAFILSVGLAAREPWRLEHICHDIYLAVAMECGQNARNVEKSIHNICRIIMENGGTPFLRKLGGGTYWNAVDLCPKDIICIFARYIRKLDPEI